MSYQLTRPRTLVRKRRRRGVGSWDDIVSIFDPPDSTAESMQCLDEANAKVAGLDARTSELAKTWKPTGFYTPDQIGTIISETLKITSAATSTLATAPLSTNDAKAMKSQAIMDVQKKAQQSLNYTAAAVKARENGSNVVDAPGLKQWVLSTMNAASSALVTASVLECQMTWLANAIIKFQTIFDAAASVIKRVAGIVIKLGQVAVKAVEEGIDLVGMLLPVAKWGAVAFAVAFVVKKIKDRR
jgi:hypothetical protein